MASRARYATLNLKLILYTCQLKRYKPRLPGGTQPWIPFTTAWPENQIGPGITAGEWYRRKITFLLDRYTYFPTLCTALAPVYIFTTFTTANQKSPSTTGVHKPGALKPSS